MRVILEGMVQRAVPERKEFDGKVRHWVVLYVFDGEQTCRVRVQARDEAEAKATAAKFKTGQEVKLPVVVDIYQGKQTVRAAEAV